MGGAGSFAFSRELEWVGRDPYFAPASLAPCGTLIDADTDDDDSVADLHVGPLGGRAIGRHAHDTSATSNGRSLSTLMTDQSARHPCSEKVPTFASREPARR
jgi:hypothetical protein